MTRAHRGRKGAAIGAAALAALAIAACGDDDETSTTAADTEASGGVLTGDGLVSCLQAAGYDASLDDPVTGLDAEHTNVVMPLGDLDQGAEFVVFGSEADAQADESGASALIGVSPTELTGNVVWGFDASAGETPDDQRAVEGCLP